MLELRLHVERDAVQADPALQAHADGGDLVLAQGSARLRPVNPHADAAFAHAGLHVESGEGADDPVFEVGHEGTHVAAAGADVEHQVGHALAGAVIGVLTAASGIENREAGGVFQVGGFGGRAGGVEGRMFQEPHQFPGALIADGPCPRVHHGERGAVGNRGVGDRPVNVREFCHGPRDIGVFQGFTKPERRLIRPVCLK